MNLLLFSSGLCYMFTRASFIGLDSDEFCDRPEVNLCAPLTLFPVKLSLSVSDMNRQLVYLALVVARYLHLVEHVKREGHVPERVLLLYGEVRVILCCRIRFTLTFATSPIHLIELVKEELLVHALDKLLLITKAHIVL